MPEVSLATEQAAARIRLAQSGLPALSFILAVIPEVEARVDDIIRDLVTVATADQSAVSSFLLVEHFESYFRTWDSREQLLKGMFSITTKGTPLRDSFRVLVEARNALMHGNGYLTALQTKSLSSLMTTKADMARVLGIQFHGRRLILSQVSTERLGTIACNYLYFIDAVISQARVSTAI
jgi:hypothetical protein